MREMTRNISFVICEPSRHGPELCGTSRQAATIALTPVIPTKRDERAFTWGPIPKRSAGMGSVRASSEEESAPLHFLRPQAEPQCLKVRRFLEFLALREDTPMLVML